MEDSKYNIYKKYDKLVRDKIIKTIKAQGKPCKYYIASEEEYWKKLKEKLLEECNEFIEDNNENEIADILEIIDAICKFKKWKKKDITKIKKQKAKERGKFNKRLILEES